MDWYFEYFGLPRNASLNQIKKAYRKKAKELHPDRNKNHGAHDEFIELNTYYEILINYKTGKVYNDTTQQFQSWQKARKPSREEILRRARERAKYYAQQSYEDFLTSEAFRKNHRFEIRLETFRVVVLLFITLGIPILASLVIPVQVWTIALMVNVLLLPWTVKEIREIKRNRIRFKKFQEGLEAYLAKKKP